MSDDLVRRLRHEQNLCAVIGDSVTADFMREAASAIEAKDAENERLRIAAGDARKKSETSYLRAIESRTAWRARAEQAGRELDVANANHRQMSKQMADLGRELAEAVEVLRPFAEIGTGESFAFATRELPDLVIARPNGSRLAFVGRDDFIAARQFVKEHGKP